MPGNPTVIMNHSYGSNPVTAYLLHQVQALTFRNRFGFPSW